ncbi:response regulator transcription factor [Azospirillum picis]|uniref:DNA-binding NarL/FixJ family response regulator n=1 Tax=Azospirillum picis TaxID=488438 RepID=A0ABU0MRL2_9PROT|nr:response regulator transcription factor [Azospirillum picis]MBP2300867.1 DNA-binding NarL/FixJ family response regulator [Azospirillum picis]MDQ0536124.1 DNA-binding NarL/FixJ family response regulator [Azospirillum picis]
MRVQPGTGEELRSDAYSVDLHDAPREAGGVPPVVRRQPLPGSLPGKAHRSVLLVDGRQLTLECFASWLEPRVLELSITPCASVEKAARRPDLTSATVALVLLNLGSRLVSDPRSADELSMLEELLPGVPVIIISDHEDTQHIVDAFECGARGYIPTSTAISVVVGAIRLVESGGVFIPASALTTLARHQKARLPAAGGGTADKVPRSFTHRQGQVLACLREGKPNKLIAHELSMCESTVKVHVRHIMKKLGATNRTQVAYLTNNLFHEK